MPLARPRILSPFAGFLPALVAAISLMLLPACKGASLFGSSEVEGYFGDHGIVPDPWDLVAGEDWGTEAAPAPAPPGSQAPPPRPGSPPPRPASPSLQPASLAPSQPSAATSRSPRERELDAWAWTADRVDGAIGVSGFDLAPGGQAVVWVRSTSDPDEDDVFLTLDLAEAASDREIRLTRGFHHDHSPRWSPGGDRIAFLSDREDPALAGGGGKLRDGEGGAQAEGPHEQVWLIDPRGGEPWRLTDFPRGVQDFAWRTGGSLLVLAEEGKTLREIRQEEAGDDARVVEDEEHVVPVRLFEVDASSGVSWRLFDDPHPSDALWVDATGRWAMTRHVMSPHSAADARVKPRFFLHDFGDPEAGDGDGAPPATREVFAKLPFKPQEVVFLADGRRAMALIEESSDPQWDGSGAHRLVVLDLESLEVSPVDLGWERGVDPGAGVSPVPEGAIVLLADGTHLRPVLLREDAGGAFPSEPLRIPRGDPVQAIVAARDGSTVVVERSAADSPPRRFLMRRDGAGLELLREFAAVNESLRDLPLARAEVVSWEGAGGDRIEGILYWPSGYEEGRRYPLVVSIHGGPAGVDRDAWRQDWTSYPHLLAERGAFVLRPNYHGSSGYGQAFCESIKGRYYEQEVPDILAGVDALIARGLVDPDRLGVMGWSNGGILTIALTVETDRFRAACPGAGDVNWASDFGNCEFGVSFDTSYLGGAPWELPEAYVAKSPLFRLDRVTTPTLLQFGTEDRSVPTQQGWEHFRALQQLGNAPVRFVLHPGEPHGLRKPSHRRRKIREEIQWFERYLFGTEPARNEALDPDSDLAVALAREGYARDGVRLGVRVGAVLAPEVVAVPDLGEGLSVGRFEVTRAQFAAFDPALPVPPGEENLPVTGIDASRARAYCQWLSGVSGAVVRLPAQDEMDRLLDLVSSPDENVLDRWAGYGVGPDDYGRLLPEIKRLGPGAPLLFAVGSLPASLTPEEVYDVDGNAAEWVEQEDGRTEPRGGCAALPADPSAAYPVPADYIGFRIVREGAGGEGEEVRGKGAG